MEKKQKKPRNPVSNGSALTHKSEAAVDRLRFDVEMLAKYYRSPQYPKGIGSGYALGDLCNISSPTVASRTFQGDMTQIGDITIERICAGFNCSPSDWIITRPDLMAAEGKALRRARSALGLKPADFAAEFSGRVGFEFDYLAVDAWERGEAKVRDGIWQAIAIALIEVGTAKARKPSK